MRWHSTHTTGAVSWVPPHCMARGFADQLLLLLLWAPMSVTSLCSAFSTPGCGALLFGAVLRSQVVDLQALAASASPPQQQAVPANSSGSNKSSLSMQQQSQRLSSTQQDGPAAVQPMLQHLLLHGVATGLVSTGLSVAQLLQ